MKKLVLLLGAFALICCGERKEVGDIGATGNDTGAPDSIGGEKAGKITKAVEDGSSGATTDEAQQELGPAPREELRKLIAARPAVQRSQAEQAVRALQQAILSYQLEYGRLPCDGEQDVKLNTRDDAIMSILLGAEDKLNVRRKRFYQGKRAKDAKGQAPVDGIYGEIEHLKLADPWGQPYFIIMDANYDGKVQNPKSADGGEDTLRGRSVIAWSTGKPRKEGVPNEPKDWLTSW